MFFFPADKYQKFFKTYLGNNILNYTQYVRNNYLGFGNNTTPQCEGDIVVEIAEFHAMFVACKYKTKTAFPDDVEEFIVVDPAKLYLANRTEEDPPTLAECARKKGDAYLRYCEQKFTYSSIFNLTASCDALMFEHRAQFELNFSMGIVGGCQVYKAWYKKQVTRKRTPGPGMGLEDEPPMKKMKVGEYTISQIDNGPTFTEEDTALFEKWQEEHFDAWGTHPKSNLYNTWCTQGGHFMHNPPTLSPIPSPTATDPEEYLPFCRKIISGSPVMPLHLTELIDTLL